jgi:hypothetical protein
MAKQVTKPRYKALVCRSFYFLNHMAEHDPLQAFFSIVALFAVAIRSDREYRNQERQGMIDHYSEGKPGLLVESCSFKQISYSGEGGAIYFWSHCTCRVTASLFPHCAGGTGGVDCSASTDRSVLWAEPDDQNRNSDLYDDSFVVCHAGNSGTAFADSSPNFRLARLNFTACEGAKSGSAFTDLHTDGRFQVSYLIFLSLRGVTGIESGCSSVRPLVYGNFYNNSYTDLGNVLSGSTDGLSVHCVIFEFNSRDF